MRVFVILSALVLAVVSVLAEGEDGSMVLPKLLHKVAPKSPASFRNLGFEAHVVLNANVTETGSVESVALASCRSWAPGEAEFHEEPAKRCEPFVKSATDAVLKWTYQPATQGGMPVRTLYTVRVSFVHKR
jgi:hypothetical protein